LADPFVGEIRMFGGNFAPVGWALCNGQILPIAENQALFTLIGTTYGGDGQTTFQLPDLRCRLPMHQGPGVTLGQAGGSETVTLTVSELPGHGHPTAASSGGGNQGGPGGAVWAAAPAKIYAGGPANTPMYPLAVAMAGGSQPHDNMSPFLGVNFIISLSGIFPSQG
jgi:microcystin-dependent protein